MVTHANSFTFLAQQKSMCNQPLGPRSVPEKENKNYTRYWDIPGIGGEHTLNLILVCTDQFVLLFYINPQLSLQKV